MAEVKSILDLVNNPQDLRKLSLIQLDQLAQEIRQMILRVTDRNGGHLASSLGVVELTIALHRVFNSPQDAIIWDVGHQCYTHKILTGRKLDMERLRQPDGPSGFPTRIESEHDVFGTGHSSTSLSAATGMAVAKRLKKEPGLVIAVIGDASLTGGMAMEALNHLADLQENVLIIINENGMSIDEHQGKVAKADLFPEFIKGFGLSEEKDVVDGHDLSKLMRKMQRIKKQAESEPRVRVLRVKTVKGKGYLPAEQNPTKYHGVNPGFLMAEDHPIAKAVDWSSMVGKTMLEIMQQDEKVVVVCPAMGSRSGFGEVMAMFPERFFDPGIVEQHAVTMAAGLAAAGMKPFVSIYSTFLQRAYDQLIHDVAIQNLPVRFLVDRVGFGADRVTHDGIYDLLMLSNAPNMKILTPKTGQELVLGVKTLWQENDGPSALRIKKALLNESLVEVEKVFKKNNPLLS